MNEIMPLDTERGDELLQTLRRAARRDAGDANATDVLDAVADAIYALDDDGRLVYVNRAYEQLSGYERDELLGEHVSVFLSEDVLERAKRLVRSILDDPDRSEGMFEFTSERSDGEMHIYDNKVTVLTDRKGGYCGLIGVLRDVTDERQLRTSKHQYEAIFDDLQEGLLVVRRDEAGDTFRYSDVNPAAADIVGLDRSKMLGASPLELYPEPSATHIEQLYREVFETGKPREIEHTNQMPRGEIVTRSHLQALDVRGGRRQVLVLIQDITELARSQYNREQDRTALRELYELAGRTELDLSEKLKRLLRIGCQRLDLPYGFVANVEGDRHRIVRAVGDHPDLETGETTSLDETLCRKTIEHDEVVVYEDIPRETSGEPAYDDFGLRCYLGGEVEVEGRLEGTLCFASRDSRDEPFSDADKTFVRLLAAWIGRELEREGYLETIEHKARTDSLTGLPNREEVLRALFEEIERARRHDHSVAFLLMDLDHFKEINDQYGHWTGDEVLRDVGRLLREETRTSDVAGRYGGEEFAVVVPHADLEEGRHLAERIRSTLERRVVETDQGDIDIRGSIGVTEYQGKEDSAEVLVKRADRALYRAKNKGRNCIVTDRDES